MDMDFSELSKLGADLGEAPAKAGANIRKAIQVTARHIKDDWQEPLKGSTYVPAGAASITYDIRGAAALSGSSVTAEIGPELGRAQGPIVGLLEEGTPRTGGRGFGLAALQKNQEDFENGLSKALEDSL